MVESSIPGGPKKILLIYRVDANNISNAGIIQKMQGQKRALQSMNHSCDAVYLKGQEIYLNESLLKNTPNQGPPILLQLLFYKYLLKIKLGEDYDIIWLRYGITTRHKINYLKYLKKQNAKSVIIMDMPTYPYKEEWSGVRGRVALWMDSYYRKKLTPLVNFMLHQGSEENLWKIPTLRITNGIDCRNISSSEGTQNGIIKMVALGKWQNWHGLDRILIGLFQYQQEKNTKPIHLTIIGEGPESENLEKIIRNYNLTSIVRMAGAAKGKTLDDLMNGAHLGIGTLGAHRKGLEMHASLKHREYCCRGIPFIYSGTDPDFSDEIRFTFQVDSTDSPINITSLINFKFRCQEIKNLPEIMKDYATRNLDWYSRCVQIMKRAIEEEV